MDKIRIVLIAGLILVSMLLVREYVAFKKAEKAVTTELSSTTASANEIYNSSDNGEEIPSLSKSQDSNAVITSKVSNQLITVETDTLLLEIDPKGGDIVSLALKDYAKNIDAPEQLFYLLENSPKRSYIAQSGLIGPNGTDTSKGRPLFSVAKSHYQLADGKQTLHVDLQLEKDQATITKRFIFNRGNFLIGMQYIIKNHSQKDFKAAVYGQIKRDNSQDPAKEGDVGGMGMQPFLGFAITTNDERFKKVDFDDLADEQFKTKQQGGWVALIQHYFLSAWVANEQSQNTYTMLQTREGFNIARFTNSVFTVAPGEQKTIENSFYAGPKDQYRLEQIAENLDLSVDYGWLWMIAQPLYALLYFFNEGKLHAFGAELDIFSGLGNWGFSIILLTILVKALFFGLNAKAYRSMAKMRAIQPKMLAIKDRFPDDRQAQSKEMMALYSKEGVNPIGGCLPMIVQMPVFIALYWVLLESVELRHAPFIGYIQDLSAMDPYFILPLIMGASMWLQQRLNPAPPDPMQAKVMQFLPIIFTFFFLFFPAGLVLYWVVNNILSIAQQWVITRKIEAESAK